MTDENMFCFQCEQTAGCTACTGVAGVCGKTADVARLQDELTGALVALARAENGGKGDTESDGLMLEGMFACVSNVSFDPKAITFLERRVRAKAIALGEFDLYDMDRLWGEQEDIRSLKSLLLFGMRGVAALVVTIVAIFILGQLLKRTLGGQTGDTLGAAIELGELIFLLALL